MAKDNVQVVVTGNKIIDRRLKLFEANVQRQVVRKATRRAMKEVVLPEAQKNIMNTSYDTGSFYENIRVRAKTRSRRQIGSRITTIPDTDAFYDDVWYYKFPELGSKHQPAEAPMRKALYETANESRGVFESYMRLAVMQA